MDVVRDVDVVVIVVSVVDVVKLVDVVTLVEVVVRGVQLDHLYRHHCLGVARRADRDWCVCGVVQCGLAVCL